jgi:pyruvate formate lyase activating enzyme
MIASVVPTRHWHRLENGDCQCDVCPRHCKLGEGQRGLCFVRARQDDAIVLTTFGRSSGFCVDPIEKKPLNHFLPGTPVLSFGTAGCNLTCRFCQNWDISKSREIDTLSDSAAPDAIATAARALGCRSVAFTYNDPVVFLEYAVATAEACHAVGVKTVAVTAGYVSDAARRELFASMDAANVDLKAFSEDFYRRTCTGSLSAVLETLRYLHDETQVWLEVTTLLIPGANDSEAELHAASQWMAEHLGPEVPWHFTAFHPDYKMLDRRATPPETLVRAHTIATSYGLRYVYTGNVHDAARGSTYCSGCGTLLIGRDWYRLTAWNLDDAGSCRACGARCAGVFDGRAGQWGARRLPVRLADFVARS